MVDTPDRTTGLFLVLVDSWEDANPVKGNDYDRFSDKPLLKKFDTPRE